MLTFDHLREGNIARLPLFKNGKGKPAHNTVDGSDWPLSGWVNAVLGEHGEAGEELLIYYALITTHLGRAANTIKKIERGDIELENVRARLAREFADVQIYLDILAFRCDINLGVSTMQTWNKKCEELDIPLRLTGTTGLIRLP